jgi:hypothetical protein
MNRVLFFLFWVCAIPGAFAQLNEIQLANTQDQRYTRVEQYQDGYYTFSVGFGPGYLAMGQYAMFSNDYLTSGVHDLPGVVDMIWEDDSMGYLLEVEPYCDWGIVSYTLAKVRRVSANFTSEQEWIFPEEVTYQTLPRLHKVNDSLLMVFDSFSAQVIHLLSGEVHSFSFDGFFQQVKAINDGNNTVILYDSSRIYRFNALSGELTLLDTDSNLRSMVKIDFHTFRLYDDSVVQFLNYNQALSSFPCPANEVSTAELVVKNNVIHLMTDAADTHAKRIYFLNQQLNALASVVLQDSDELNVKYFLGLSNRFFLAGFRQLHNNCRQINFRYHHINGELIEHRTENLSVDDVQVSGVSAYLFNVGNNYMLSVGGDFQITITNHSDVMINEFVLSRPRFEQPNGMLPQCALNSGCVNISPTQSLSPGETITLNYENVGIGQFSPQSVGTTFQMLFCVTAHAPNGLIDKDQSNDKYCYQITHVISDIQDREPEAMKIQKQNGSWICTNVREAQIELFDLTGRLLLRAISTEDQFFLPEINEHATISLVRITKGDEQLVQKLSGF